eukprot:2510991-Amphidinium_carterae.1
MKLVWFLLHSRKPGSEDRAASPAVRLTFATQRHVNECKRTCTRTGVTESISHTHTRTLFACIAAKPAEGCAREPKCDLTCRKCLAHTVFTTSGEARRTMC